MSMTTPSESWTKFSPSDLDIYPDSQPINMSLQELVPRDTDRIPLAHRPVKFRPSRLTKVSSTSRDYWINANGDWIDISQKSYSVMISTFAKVDQWIFELPPAVNTIKIDPSLTDHNLPADDYTTYIPIGYRPSPPTYIVTPDTIDADTKLRNSSTIKSIEIWKSSDPHTSAKAYLAASRKWSTVIDKVKGIATCYDNTPQSGKISYPLSDYAHVRKTLHAEREYVNEDGDDMTIPGVLEEWKVPAHMRTLSQELTIEPLTSTVPLPLLGADLFSEYLNPDIL